jgi:hypothetical protein
MTQRSKTEIRNLAQRLSLNVTPYDWLTKAQLLRQASNYLLVRFEEDQLVHDEEFERTADFDLNPPDSSVLMMLLGFAIENLLKGLYVSTLPNVKRPRTLKELGITDHLLETIASKITAALNEQFSKRELEILSGIEQSIVWWGRYPSPIDTDKLISRSADSLFSAPSFRYPADHFDACAFCDRLEALLKPRAPFSIQRMLLGNTANVGLMPGEVEDSKRREA